MRNLYSDFLWVDSTRWGEMSSATLWCRRDKRRVWNLSYTWVPQVLLEDALDWTLMKGKERKKWRQNYIRVEWSLSWSGQGLWRKDETYVLSSVLIKGSGLCSLSFSVISCWLPPRQGYLGHGRYHYLKQVKRWLVTESLDCSSCKSWPRRIWVVYHEAHHVGSEGCVFTQVSKLHR